MHNIIEISQISDNDFGSNHGGYNLPMPVLSPPQNTPNPNSTLPRSNLQPETFAEKPPLSSTSSMPAEKCVVSG